MELLTTIPLRTDGTVVVNLNLGGKKTAVYTFKEDDETGAGVCEVEEAHVELLVARGVFMSRSDYEDEVALLKRIAQRNARMANSGTTPGTFNPLDMNSSTEEEEEPVNSMAPPEEGGARPTGRVRKASK